MTTIMTLLHVYVFVRLGSLPWFRRLVDRRVFIAAAVVLWLLFFLGRSYGGHQHGLLTMVLEVVAMHWLGSLFLIAMTFFIADLACGFGFLFPNPANRIRTLGLACGLILVVIAHVQGLRLPGIEVHEVSMKGLPAELDGTTVAVVSDLHVGEMMVDAGWLNARVDQVQKLEPDLVVLVGDLFERGSEPADLVPVMRRLRAPLGIWAVRGNHDRLRSGRRDVTGEILAGADIRLLENEWVEAADCLVLAGIDDLTSSRRRPGEAEANFERALVNRPASATIFLSHTPWLVEEAAASGVNLMLSGHTHDGQIWPFNHLVRTRYPFYGGRYNLDSMALVVSRGTGTWGPRMRLWNPGEISLITLRADNTQPGKMPSEKRSGGSRTASAR